MRCSLSTLHLAGLVITSSGFFCNSWNLNLSSLKLHSIGYAITKICRVSFTDFLQHIKFFEFVKRDEYILYKLESKEINLCLERYKEFEESYNSIIDFLSQFSVKDGEISFIPLLDFIPEVYTKICSALRVSFHGDLLKAISVIVKDIIQRNSPKTRYLNPDFLYEKTSEIFG